jgi:hypothetical protein
LGGTRSAIPPRCIDLDVPFLRGPSRLQGPVSRRKESERVRAIHRSRCPYRIGNGWFGGTLPLIAGLLVAKTGNIYAGLYWVMAVALMTFFIGTFFLSESNRTEIWKEAEEARPAA